MLTFILQSGIWIPAMTRTKTSPPVQGRLHCLYLRCSEYSRQCRHNHRRGHYLISGTMDDGMIIVDTEKSDKTQLVLNRAIIHCQTNAPT